MSAWLLLCGGGILAASILIWSLCRAAASVQSVEVNEDGL